MANRFSRKRSFGRIWFVLGAACAAAITYFSDRDEGAKRRRRAYESAVSLTNDVMTDRRVKPYVKKARALASDVRNAGRRRISFL